MFSVPRGPIGQFLVMLCHQDFWSDPARCAGELRFFKEVKKVIRELSAEEISCVQGAGLGEFIEGAMTAIGGATAIGAGMSAGGAAAAAAGATAVALTLGGVLLVAAGAGLVAYGVHEMTS